MRLTKTGNYQNTQRYHLALWRNMPSYPQIQDADGSTKFLRNIADHQYCTAMYPSISDQPAAFPFKVEDAENECLTQRFATTYGTYYTVS